MVSYIVTVTVGLDQPIHDEVARDVAGRWAAHAGFDLGMTSTARDEPWLRVQAGIRAGAAADLAQIATSATGHLAVELREAGHAVEQWHAVEVVSADEAARRKPVRAMPDGVSADEAARRKPVCAMPDVVNATEFADLAGLTRQRIYQYESDRKAGKRDGFPAPVLDGYWLRNVAEHWASTRRRKPGPAPRSTVGDEAPTSRNEGRAAIDEPT